jgi:hypothetical protein
MKEIKMTTEKEMYDHILRFNRMNVSQREYCKMHGMTADKFRYWRDKFFPSTKTKNKKIDVLDKPKFIPVNIESAKTMEFDSSLQIEYPNGVKLNLPSNCDISSIVNLIKSF